jgi:hypothetical protein
MKKYGLLLLAWAAGAAMAAGQDKKPAWRFHSINTVGWIKGKSTSAIQLQTVNGFRKEQVFLGLGAGMDHYLYAGIPVFIDTRYYSGARSSAFFLYADGGIHIATAHESLQGYDIRFRNGFYSDLGMGFGIGCGRYSAIELAAGWTYKRVTRRQSIWIQPLIGPGYENADSYVYDLTRLVVKAGFRF